MRHASVFIHPFTNDVLPRSPRLPQARAQYATRQWLRETSVGRGASTGANATITSAPARA